MQTTKLNIEDKLPLTCSRSGACCHGNVVMLNPWELVCIAKEKKMTTQEFRDQYCDLGGIRLRFDGPKAWKGKHACSQYVENFGCSVHVGRPLACRLFPIGRQVQNEQVQYIFQGSEFPCIKDCPEVTDLPQLSVEEYLVGQNTTNFEKASDAYLDLMQNLADIAFVLLLDTGLADSHDTSTLPEWRRMANDEYEEIAEVIGEEWIDYLTIPEIADNIEDPIAFVQQHTKILQNLAQKELSTLDSLHEMHEASVHMMAVTLHLGRALGANASELVEHWIKIAKTNGALE